MIFILYTTKTSIIFLTDVVKASRDNLFILNHPLWMLKHLFILCISCGEAAFLPQLQPKTDALPRPSQSAFLPLNDPSGTFRSTLPAASFNSTQNNSNRYIFSLALNLKVFFSFFFSCVHKYYYFEICLSHSLPTLHTVRKEITAKKNAVLNNIFSYLSYLY